MFDWSCWNITKIACDTFDHNFKYIPGELGVIRKALFCIIRWWPYFKIVKIPLNPFCDETLHINYTTLDKTCSCWVWSVHVTDGHFRTFQFWKIRSSDVMDCFTIYCGGYWKLIIFGYHGYLFQWESMKCSVSRTGYRHFILTSHYSSDIHI